jgi:hypothetical protein
MKLEKLKEIKKMKNLNLHAGITIKASTRPVSKSGTRAYPYVAILFSF